MPNVPQDTRWGDAGQGLGAGIGSIIAGFISAKKQKDVTDYAKANPDADAASLYAQAGGDPGAHDLVTTIVARRLQNAQIAEAKAKAQQDLASAQHEQAQTAVGWMDVAEKQFDQGLQGLKVQGMEADIAMKKAAAAGDMGKLAEAQANVQKIQLETKETQTRLDLINQMRSSFAPQVLGPSGQDVGAAQQAPATGGGSAPQMAGYPAGSPNIVDDLTNNANMLDKFTKSPAGRGLDVGYSGGGVTVKMDRGPAVTEQESDRAATMLSLAQVLESINDSVVKNAKTGKLELGPISGQAAQLAALFSKDPNNPNVDFGVWSGHSNMTAGALMPNTRQGVQMMANLRDLMVNAKKGAAFNEVAAKNSMRILINEANAMAKNQLNNRSMGADATPFLEIGRLGRQMFSQTAGGPRQTDSPGPTSTPGAAPALQTPATSGDAQQAPEIPKDVAAKVPQGATIGYNPTTKHWIYSKDNKFYDALSGQELK